MDPTHYTIMKYLLTCVFLYWLYSIVRLCQGKRLSFVAALIAFTASFSAIPLALFGGYNMGAACGVVAWLAMAVDFVIRFIKETAKNYRKQD